MIIYKYIPHTEYTVTFSSGGLDLSNYDIYINNTQSFQSLLPDIFNDYDIIREKDEWSLPNDLFLKLMHRKPRLNEYFNFYRCQLNFALFAATSALGISKEHLTVTNNNLIRSFYRFHVYYHIRRILHKLHAAIPGEDHYKKWNNNYSENAYYKLCKEYGISDPNTIWMYGTWRYDAVGVFNENDTKSATEYTKINNDYSRWISETSHGFTKQGLYMISESVMMYVYLILASQASSRSTLIGNNANALTTQQVFINTFENIINRETDIQSDIKRYQDVLNNANSEVNFSVGDGIYMMPSDMNLKIGKVFNYNNKILIAKPGYSVGVNKINLSSQAMTHTKTTTTTTHSHVGHNNNNKVISNSHSDVITHEEEKLALILFFTIGFTIWYMFKP